MTGCTFGKTGVGIVRGIQLFFETRKMLEPSKVKILNDIGSEEQDVEEDHKLSDPKQVVGLSKELHKQVLKLKGEFLGESGLVAYPTMRDSPAFAEFQAATGKLKGVAVGVAGMNEDEKKAFFINIYNTLTVHALARVVNNETTVLQIPTFWQLYGYRIGEFTFSLDDIEHGVLRCNKPHPSMKQQAFKEGDLRKTLIMKELDPRVHFALNCGAKSCPPIKLFSAENVDNALDLAAKGFCQNDAHVDVDKKKVTLSQILKWYGDDFGHDDTAVVERILPYCSVQAQEDFPKIRDKFKLAFTEYDWAIH